MDAKKRGETARIEKAHFFVFPSSPFTMKSGCLNRDSLFKKHPTSRSRTVELSELTAYAKEKYNIDEQHKWDDSPGFSVLADPLTGKWAALLMRVWDTETGEMIERCDIKCGQDQAGKIDRPYVTAAFRMHGPKWAGVTFGKETEADVVRKLFDSAMDNNKGYGFTIVLDSPAPKRDITVNAGGDVPIPPRGTTIARSNRDIVPERIRKLRLLFKPDTYPAKQLAEDFFRQATFMRDYEDDYPWEGPFSHFYPTYHHLTTAQLRGYFSWRTRVRKGNYSFISVSAAYIYLYELLNGIGAESVEERLQKIDFSDPFYTGGSVLIVLKNKIDPIVLKTLQSTEGVNGNDSSFISSIVRSFNRTFIQENRWNVFLSGLLRTLLITFSSMTFGCFLGFALFFLCRNEGKTVRSIVQFVTGIIVGIPAVVLLMVLFYVVFGKSSISGITVSIIAFTLTFGISVFHMLETGTGAVEYGQTEGAYALGFSDSETFFQVIFPQAILHILPIFQGELVSLLKATAVVGYIAVQDLTRAGDMVRNRTFEAFFSLISVAVIYYLIGRLLAFLIGRIRKRLDPSSRSKKQILKGVCTDVQN